MPDRPNPGSLVPSPPEFSLLPRRPRHCYQPAPPRNPSLLLNGCIFSPALFFPVTLLHQPGRSGPNPATWTQHLPSAVRPAESSRFGVLIRCPSGPARSRPLPHCLNRSGRSFAGLAAARHYRYNIGSLGCVRAPAGPSLLGDGVMVTRQTLDLLIQVRILVSQPIHSVSLTTEVHRHAARTALRRRMA